MRSVPLPALASLALLLAVLFLQYVVGLDPCKLCIWQRLPHLAAIGIGVALAFGAPRGLRYAAALVMAAGAGLAFYHSGIEYGWWPGPASCTGGAIGGLSAEELLAQIEATAVTRCDEVAWQFLGLSMATWNGIASAVLALGWMRR